MSLAYLSRIAPWRLDGRGYRLLVAACLGLGLVAAGGASRIDEDQQVFARLAAILAIAATLWPLDFEPLRRRRGVILAAGAVYVLLLAQLAPLPPDLWARLPGHGVYAQIAQAAGRIGWRPLSLTPDLTFDALLSLLPATAAGLGALYLDVRGRQRTAEGLIGIAAFSAVLGLAQLALGGGLRLYRETSADAAVGLFANRNHQAALLACALPLLGAVAGLRLRQGGDRRIIWPVALSLGALLLFGAALTGSRMGLLLAAIGTLGAVWCFRAGAPEPASPRSSRTLLFTCLAGAALILAGVAAIRGGADRLAPAGVAGDTRLAMLDPLLQTAGAFMPFGSGFGSFDSVYRRFEPNGLLSTIYMNQAHNEPLQLAIEGGAPALALLGLFGVWWVRTAARTLRRPEGGRRRTLGIAAATITVMLMASSLVDYPLRTPLLGAVFAFACMTMLRAADDPAPGSAGEVAGATRPSRWRSMAAASTDSVSRDSAMETSRRPISP